MMDSTTLMGIFRIYLEAAVLLAFGAGLVQAGSWLEGRVGMRPDGNRWLRLSQAVFLLALVLPCVAAMLPREVLLEPAAQVFTGGGSSGRAAEALTLTVARPAGVDQLVPARMELSLAKRGIEATGLLLLAGVLVFLGRWAWQRRRLRVLLRDLPLIRRVGRVSILAAGEETVPFSSWISGRAFVVVPMHLVADADDYRIALRHELQHHRQGDTRWVHFQAFIAALFFWNPALGAWSRMFTQFQEFACDDFLIGHRNVPPRAYGRCLLRTAQAALAAKAAPSGTTGMAALNPGSLLKRRIEMLIDDRKPLSRRWLSALVAFVTITLLTTSAFAARSAVQGTALTLEEGSKLAAASMSREFPVAMNELVLEKLNTFLANPKGREFMRNGLARMPEYRPEIEKQLARYKLPRELVVIPLIESGFRNMSVDSKEPSAAPGPRGAGIWMFIVPTAQKYGLVVDDKVDERLDVAKETDAAMRYFSDIQKQFGDIWLTVAAYNQGEKHVQRVLEEKGSRDAFELARAGKLNDYLATVMAGIIIMKNPQLLD